MMLIAQFTITVHDAIVSSFNCKRSLSLLCIANSCIKFNEKSSKETELQSGHKT